jgi:hypothetical protein
MNLQSLFSKRVEITKREKFVSSSIVAALGFLIIQFLPVGKVYYWSVFGFATLVLICLFWSLEKFTRLKFLTLSILPLTFTVSLTLFVSLLPQHFLIPLATSLVFALVFYSLLLTLNIYNVAAIRTIALVRAAHSVGFLFGMLSAFFAFEVIFALHLSFYLITVLVFATSFLVSISILWSFELEEYISWRVLIYSLVLAFIVAQFALVFAFWPIIPMVAALGSVGAFYVSLGLTQFHFNDRLNRNTVFEYTSVAFVVFILLILTARWGG